MAFKRILIPIDKSDKTLKSLETVRDLFNKDDVQIVLLHVIDEFNVSAVDYVSPEFIDSVTELSHTVLARAAEQISEYDVEKISTLGTPAKVIFETVEKNNIDLILMTKTGSGIVDKYILGSVTSKVVKKADVPVMVIP